MYRLLPLLSSFLLCLVIAIAPALQNRLFAQSAGGSIIGKIMDGGAPAESATVLLLKEGEPVTGALSAPDGAFSFEDVPPGPYELKVTYVGTDTTLQIVVQSGISTDVGVIDMITNVTIEEILITDSRIVTSDQTIQGTQITQEQLRLRGSRNYVAASAKGTSGPTRKQRQASLNARRADKAALNPPNAAKDKLSRKERRKLKKERRSMMESYEQIVENDFTPVKEEEFSTFSIDVDGAAYANIRRMLNSGQVPPENAVRLEEMINYFDYPTYEEPDDGEPFSIISEIGGCPWNKKHRLLRVALKGDEVKISDLPPLNLVFLIDVSGSMGSSNKLPLVKESLRMLVERLRPQDKVALAVYAGNAGLVLPPTPGTDRQKILDGLNNLTSGGSTAGGAGIKLAYKTLRDNFVAGGVNRVIIATDGDFNVGVNNPNDLVKLIEKERDADLYLTVLGFGQGNYRDDMTERLSNAGNGYAAYIDSKAEAKKVLVDEFSASMLTIANDLKLQLEFNEEVVKSYRLIGYENRLLNFEDFKDDKVDAGDVGAGHTVTALYELIPAGRTTAGFRPTVTVNLRYKTPGDTTSKPLTYDVVDRQARWAELDADFRFAASAAAFGMLLRGSNYSGAATLNDVKNWASAASANDPEGRRKEFLELLDKYEALQKAAQAKKLEAGK